MATTIQQIHPVAHLPLVLGVLRRLEVATVIDRLIPPHPAHGLSCGRGVEALVLAILDGHHALYKVGRRLEERGMLTLLQPGFTRAALNDYRLGISSMPCLRRISTRCLARWRSKPWRSMPSRRPGCIRIPPPLRCMARMRTSHSVRSAPPAYGHSKDGRDDLKQVLLSLGVSGDGGIPLRWVCGMATE